MKLKRGFVPLLGLLLSGCLTTETHYKTVNGMAYCQNCKAIIVSTSESTKVALPTGGYAGAQVNLGAIEKSETRADVSKTLGVINQSIVSACEGQKAAAFANDRTAYDFWAKVQQNQIVKLQQLSELMVSQENTSAAAATATPAPSPATQPQEVAQASPPPEKKKKDAKLKRWASLYSPKNAGKLKLPKGTKVAAPGTAPSAPPDASPTPPVVTPAVKAVLETQPKSPEVLGLKPGS